MKAEYATDGDLNSISETQGGWNIDLWFKMKFDEVFCFFEVVIIQAKLNWYYANRMQDLKVFVVNTDTGIDNLCGVLKISSDYTIEGQTYKIPCHLKCGNEVKLTLRHDRGSNSVGAVIHMREIMAFGAGMSTKCLTHVAIPFRARIVIHLQLHFLKKNMN